MPGPMGGAPPCPVCQDRVYFNEEKAFMGRSWHKKCFRCAECSKVLEGGTANLSEDEALHCGRCFRRLVEAAAGTAPAPAPRRQEMVDHDHPECCPRCGKKVYFAEQMLSLGRKWHKSCFTCAACKKKVDSTSCADHDGDLYCKPCYGRHFGPKGYGFAGGAGTGLSMDTGRGNQARTDNVPRTAQAYVAPIADKIRGMSLTGDHGDGDTNGDGGSNGHNGSNGHSGANGNGHGARPKWGGGDYCARCNNQVFLAEKRQAAGNYYHNTCFTCYICSKKLDSGMLTEKESEIFCKVCYGKRFGPKGYGFGGGAGTLQMT